MLNLLWFQFLQCDDTLLFSVWWWFYIIFWHLIKQLTNRSNMFSLERKFSSSGEVEWAKCLKASPWINLSRKCREKKKKKKGQTWKEILFLWTCRGLTVMSRIHILQTLSGGHMRKWPVDDFRGDEGVTVSPLLSKWPKCVPSCWPASSFALRSADWVRTQTPSYSGPEIITDKLLEIIKFWCHVSIF